MSKIGHFHLCDDLVTEIIKFEPHWTLALIDHQWFRAWKVYTRNLESPIEIHLRRFEKNRIKGFVSNHFLNCDPRDPGTEHRRRTRQNRKMVTFLLPAGINIFAFDRCTICHQELSHDILREYTLLVGSYNHEILFHIVTSPLEILGDIDLSRNDPCQYLLGKYVMCRICADVAIPQYITVTEFLKL